MISAPREIFCPDVFRLFVHELGRKRVCQMLDITKVTLERWLKGTSPIPKMAMRAIYWETQYGRSLIETDQVNEIRLLFRRVCILQDQFQRAKEIVTGLRRLQTGTANEAIFEELASFPDLPPDTYGAIAHKRSRANVQAQATHSPSRQAMPGISEDAKIAAVGFENLRRAASR